MKDFDCFLNTLAKIPIDLNRNKIFNSLEKTENWPLHYKCGQRSCEIVLPNDYTYHSELYNKNVLDYKLVQKLYTEGYTLLLSNIGHQFEEVKEFQSQLNDYFHKKININLYAGNGTKTVSFLNHFHSYSVIVRNVQGKSVWIFNHDQEVIFENNKVVYFEPNVFHYVKEICDDKITLTCNLDF